MKSHFLMLLIILCGWSGTCTAQAQSPGTVLTWGGFFPPPLAAPVAAQSGVTAIAAGGVHSVALKNDGAVVAWGFNDYGQTTVPVMAQSGVRAIAAGAALTAPDTVPSATNIRIRSGIWITFAASRPPPTHEPSPSPPPCRQSTSDETMRSCRPRYLPAPPPNQRPFLRHRAPESGRGYAARFAPCWARARVQTGVFTLEATRTNR